MTDNLRAFATDSQTKTSKQGLSDWPGDTFKVILGPDFFLSLVDTQEMKQSNRTEKHRKLVRIS